MFQGLHLPPKQQANIFATGFMVILTLGLFAVIALVIAAFWLLIQALNLLLQSIVECLTTIGQTYQSADPLVRFLILVAIAYLLYRVFRHFRKGA